MIAPPVNKLKQDSDKELIDGFSQRCTEIIREAVNHYDELGHQYDKNVYEKTRKELVSSLTNQELFYCFEKQIKLLRQKT